MIREAVLHLKARIPSFPSVGLVLGSAQASFADALSKPIEIPYSEIPGWPVPKVSGHAGQLIIGEAGGVRVAVMSGRVHLYEGRGPAEVAFGIRSLGMLGMRTLVLTNAAGGINPAYKRGLLVLISDHINLQGSNPLVGPNEDALGPRFPDMSRAYSPLLREKAKDVADHLGIKIAEGVYAGMLGPNFETPAEIRYLRAIGADLAGMSTVSETIVAVHMGIRVLGISTVTNMAAGLQPVLSHEEVLEIGRASTGDLTRLLVALLPELES